MELLGKHRVGFSQVRRSAIRCYALDIAAHPLLFEGTHAFTGEATRELYEELLTAELLTLAVALRTECYQGLDPSSSIPFVQSSGLLYRFGKRTEVTETFTVKDVCDKIIHAQSVRKVLEKGHPRPVTTLEGEAQNGDLWELSFSISLFVEGLLNWLNLHDDA